MRKGEVRVNGIPAGVLEETATGFRFRYDRDYAGQSSLPAVSLTLPKQKEPYESSVLFPFFAGLLTEGAAMQLQCRMLKIPEKRARTILNLFHNQHHPVESLIQRSFLSATGKQEYLDRFTDRLRAIA